MTITKRLLYLPLLLMMIGCQWGPKEPAGEKDSVVDNVKDAKDERNHPPTVYLQPCNTFTEAEAKKLFPAMKKEIARFGGVELDFVVLPRISLADSLKNKAKTRYRADKIISHFAKKSNSHEVYIALLHQDVSCSLRGKPDWGVLGLSISRTYTCVVSDFRLKNKQRDLWKVGVHEFVHTYFMAPHCPWNNDQCIMKDANGHADFGNKTTLCDSCSNKYNI